MGIKIPPIPSAIERVYIPVPANRVDDVFRFLLGLADDDGAVDSDLDRIVHRVFRESDEQFRRLLYFLAQRPGASVTTDEVADGLDLFRGAASLAGMLGAFGRRSNNRYDSFWPFEKTYNPIERTSELMMPPNVAAIVNRLAEA